MSRVIDDVWTEHVAPNGERYYHNRLSDTTQWDPPSPVIRERRLQRGSRASSARTSPAFAVSDEEGLGYGQASPSLEPSAAGGEQVASSGSGGPGSGRYSATPSVSHSRRPSHSWALEDVEVQKRKRPPDATEAQKRLRTADSIMRPDALQLMRRMLELGESPGSVVQLAVEAYEGHAALSRTVADLLNAAGAARGAENGSGGEAAADTGGADAVGTAAAVAAAATDPTPSSAPPSPAVAEVLTALHRLLLQRFDAGESHLWMLAHDPTRPPAWLDDLVTDARGRRALLDLADKHRANGLLSYAVRRMAERGYHTELQAAPFASTHFAVFREVLAHALAGACTGAVTDARTSDAARHLGQHACLHPHTLWFALAVAAELNARLAPQRPALAVLVRALASGLVAAALASNAEAVAAALALADGAVPAAPLLPAATTAVPPPQARLVRTLAFCCASTAAGCDSVAPEAEAARQLCGGVPTTPLAMETDGGEAESMYGRALAAAQQLLHARIDSDAQGALEAALQAARAAHVQQQPPSSEPHASAAAEAEAEAGAGAAARATLACLRSGLLLQVLLAELFRPFVTPLPTRMRALCAELLAELLAPPGAAREECADALFRVSRACQRLTRAQALAPLGPTPGMFGAAAVLASRRREAEAEAEDDGAEGGVITPSAVAEEAASAVERWPVVAAGVVAWAQEVVAGAAAPGHAGAAGEHSTVLLRLLLQVALTQPRLRHAVLAVLVALLLSPARSAALGTGVRLRAADVAAVLVCRGCAPQVLAALTQHAKSLDLAVIRHAVMRVLALTGARWQEDAAHALVRFLNNSSVQRAVRADAALRRQVIERLHALTAAWRDESSGADSVAEQAHVAAVAYASTM